MEMKKVIETDDGFRFVVDPDKLISQSKYFKSIFKYNDQPHIRISGISGDIMKQLFNYLETKNLEINGDNILAILEAADYLMLDELLGEIRRVLPGEIKSSNCIELFNVASDRHRLDISDLCYCYIQVHFEQVVGTADIGMLSFEHLKRFLTDSDLNVDSEDLVWKAIVKWVEKDAAARVENIPSLLTCIRLEDCTEEWIQGILKHPFSLERPFHSWHNPEHESLGNISASGIGYDCEKKSVKRQLIETVRSVSSEPISRGPRHRVRCSVSAKLTTYFWEDEKNVSITSNEGDIIAEIPARRNFWPTFLTTSDHRIYFFASDCAQDGMWICFDVLKSSWRNLPTPWIAYDRDEVISFAKLNSLIYALWIEPLSANLHVACFDPETNVWNEGQSAASPKSERIISMSAAVHEGLIYAVATWDDDLDHDVVEKMFGQVYDPRANVWSEMPLPEMRSEEVTIISCSEMLLMIHFEGSLVDRFYPAEGVWRKFTDLPYRYDVPRAEARDDESLLVYELFSGLDDESRHAVYWDRQSERWLDGAALLRTSLYHDFDDAEVARKYHRVFAEDKWKAVLKECEDSQFARELDVPIN